MTKYPNIYPEWLITGKGRMLRNEENTTNTQKDVSTYDCNDMLSVVQESNAILKNQVELQKNIILELKTDLQDKSEQINILEIQVNNLKKYQAPIVQSQIVAEPKSKFEKKE